MDLECDCKICRYWDKGGKDGRMAVGRIDLRDSARKRGVLEIEVDTDTGLQG
jgi:hypothetical protein